MPSIPQTDVVRTFVAHMYSNVLYHLILPYTRDPKVENVVVIVFCILLQFHCLKYERMLGIFRPYLHTKVYVYPFETPPAFLRNMTVKGYAKAILKNVTFHGCTKIEFRLHTCWDRKSEMYLFE